MDNAHDSVPTCALREARAGGKGWLGNVGSENGVTHQDWRVPTKDRIMIFSLRVGVHYDEPPAMSTIPQGSRD